MSDIEDIKITQAYLLSEQERIYSLFRVNGSSGNPIYDTLPPIVVRKQYFNENKDLVSKLIPETLKKFSELPDACLTRLTPMIKMYKVFVVDGKEYAFELIQGRIPSDLYDQTRSSQGLDNELVEYPVIQEAEFTRLGGNPAEIDTNIKFSVKLFAKDISSFMTRTVLDSYDVEQAIIERIQHYEGEILDTSTPEVLAEQHLETIETLRTELGSLQAGVGWIDIIKINPGGSLEEGTELITSEVDCRIKVEVGYIDPGDAPPPSLGQEEWNLWRDVIKSQKETFSLSLKKHQFDFRGYEGVDLTVDFIATGNAIQLTPVADIFSNMETERFIEVRRAQIRNLRSEAKNIRYAQLFGNEATGIYRDMPEYRAVRQRAHEQAIVDCLEDLDERIEYESQQILEAKARLRAQLLNQLYLSNRDSRSNASEQSRIYRRIFRYTPQVTEGKPRKYHADINYSSLESFLLATGGPEATAGEAQATLLSYNDLAAAGAGEEGYGNELVLSRLDAAEGYHQDTFIFFGDIIEAALEILAVSEESTISITSGSKSWRRGTGQNQHWSLAPLGFILGGISRVDQFLAGSQKFKSTFTWNPNTPLTSGESPNKEAAEDIVKLFGGFALGNISYKDPLDPNRIVKATIADIPIALDIFRSWWIRNYVSSPKASLSIRDFITALARFLETEVFRNIPYEYGDGSVPHDTPKFIVNNFKVPPSVKEKIYPTDWTQVKHQNFRIEEAENIENLPNKGFSITTITQVDNNNELQEDTMRLVFGETSKGILKRISFEREDIPAFAEARLFSDREPMGANIHLREKYNATFEVLGTVMFLPGSLLFLEPNPLDLGFTEEAGSKARSLGLGGMYRVVDVTSVLDFTGQGNSWKTSLRTKWTSFGGGSTDAGVAYEQWNDCVSTTARRHVDRETDYGRDMPDGDAQENHENLGSFLRGGVQPSSAFSTSSRDAMRAALASTAQNSNDEQ
jgi:hypothetical protein